MSLDRSRFSRTKSGDDPSTLAFSTRSSISANVAIALYICLSMLGVSEGAILLTPISALRNAA
jgi:hypothetical protein